MMHVKTGTRNLRSKKEVAVSTKPLSDTTNTPNMRSRKKNQENAPSASKNTSKTKPKKARKPTVSKSQKKSPKRGIKDTENDENAAPITVKSPECFGFNDSDLYDDGPACKTELTEFDCNKPYRLALYVRPSKKIRIAPSVIDQIQKLNPSLNLTNMTMNSTLARPLSQTAMSPNRTQFKVPFASTPKEKPKKKMMQMKITDSFASPKRTRSCNNDQVFKSYFENSGTSDEEVVTPPAKIVKKRAKDNVSTASERKFEATEKTEPVTFQRPNRRSYVKKSRPAPEPEDTTPTEEILKSIEKSKKKTKPKKAVKEEEEFEKWSRSMNSMFNEVDQFEISID